MAVSTNLTALTSNDVVVHEERALVIVKAALYTFIFILGVFGNTLVVKATRQYMTLRRATNIFICNLCMCDVMIMLLGIPIFLMGEHRLVTIFGVYACRVVHPMLIAGLSATVLTLVAIAIERCDMIVNSINSRLSLTPQKAIYVVGAIDFVSFILSVPLAFARLENNNFVCSKDWEPTSKMAYAVALFLVQYFVPLLVMVVLYSICWHQIRKKNRTTITMSRRQTIRERSASDGDLLKKNSSEEECSVIEDTDTTMPTSTDQLKNNGTPPVSNQMLPAGNDTQTDYLSGSQNHLSCEKSNSVQRVNSFCRRSFSADSVYDLRRESMRRRSLYIKPTSANTCDNSLFSKKQNSQSDLHSSQQKITRFSSRRQSFMCSMQRLNQSFTNLVSGADGGVDALTAFQIKRVKQTMKTLRVFTIVLLIFAVCMLPHHIVGFMFHEVSQIARFFEILIYVNAAVNPWIYAGMNKSYRVAFRDFFTPKRHPRKIQRSYLKKRKTSRLDSLQIPKKHWLLSLAQLCGRFMETRQKQDSFGNDEEEAFEALNSEHRDAVNDLDGDNTGSRKTSNGASRSRFGSLSMSIRKDSKVSRKSSASTDDPIPSLAPIIIFTNYDEEMAIQKAIEDAKTCVYLQHGGDDCEDEDRFSAIISLNDA